MSELTLLWTLVGFTVVLSLVVGIAGFVALYQDWRR